MNRLLSLRKFLKLTQSQMAEILSIKQNGYSMIETGRVGLTDRNVQLLAEKLHVNPAWLLSGEGEMFSVTPPSESGLAVIAKKVPFFSVPIQDSEVSVSFSEQRADYLIDCLPFNDCNFFRPVVGQSMSPRFNPGDIVACKEVTPGESVLFGETYLCIVRQGDLCNELLRVVRRHEDPARVILRPVNQAFGELSVDRSNILGLYLIKGKIVRNV